MDVLDTLPGAPAPEVRGPDGGVAVVLVRDEVDGPEAAMLERAVVDLCAAADRCTPPLVVVVIDLSAVSYFGSRGLAALVITRDAAIRRGVVLRVATGAGNRRVRRPIEITGIDTVLPVFDTLAQALAVPAGR